MKLIPITKGYSTVVDDEDYDFGEFAVLNFPNAQTTPTQFVPDEAKRIRELRRKTSCPFCGKSFSVAGMGMHKVGCKRKVAD